MGRPLFDKEKHITMSVSDPETYKFLCVTYGDGEVNISKSRKITHGLDIQSKPVTIDSLVSPIMTMFLAKIPDGVKCKYLTADEKIVYISKNQLAFIKSLCMLTFSSDSVLQSGIFEALRIMDDIVLGNEIKDYGKYLNEDGKMETDYFVHEVVKEVIESYGNTR